MSKLLRCTFIFFFLGCFFLSAQEKQDTILKYPKHWRYEKVNLPLDFAPKMKHKGFEELRFAPGMFDTSAEKYFTYVFVIAIDDETNFSKRKTKKLLYQYYRGLCAIVAKSSKQDVDVSKIKICLKKTKQPIKSKKTYLGEIQYFDTFNKGEAILLNIELETITDKLANKTYIIGLVSPTKKDSDVWKELHTIRKNIYYFKGGL
ncbi:hypothetical protein [uncultured Lacinutrix sp.]|uniref:hypothetical protein n=1 Tax=uncultured Lacinutrix sp. TaxID=574032 RepID=UPI002639613C|nr:hypothetical protein [uncultured Lacinutrix sp.]